MDFSHTRFKSLQRLKNPGGQIGWMRRSLRFTAFADQSFMESMLKPFHLILAVCGVALFFGTITHLDSHHDVFQVHSRTCSAHQCNAPLQETASSFAFSNQNGPIIPCFDMATQSVHFAKCKGSEAPRLELLSPSSHSSCYWRQLCIIAELNVIKEVRIRLNLVLEPPAHH